MPPTTFKLLSAVTGPSKTIREASLLGPSRRKLLKDWSFKFTVQSWICLSLKTIFLAYFDLSRCFLLLKVKFIHSERATKIWHNLPLRFDYWKPSQKTWTKFWRFCSFFETTLHFRLFLIFWQLMSKSERAIGNRIKQYG